MKKNIWVCAFIVMIACVGICSAEEATADTSETNNAFIGTWVNFDNVLVLSSDGLNITGTYEKSDGSVLDMEGTLSEDRKVLNGSWICKGKFRFIFSDEGTSFNGTFGYVTNDTTEGVAPSVYVREENASIDENAMWNGTWTYENGIAHLTQDENIVTGTDSSGDTPITIHGTVSEDGKILSGDWNLTGLYSFTISDDETFFNGTYGYGSDVPGSYPWHSVRIE